MPMHKVLAIGRGLVADGRTSIHRVDEIRNSEPISRDFQNIYRHTGSILSALVSPAGVRE